MFQPFFAEFFQIADPKSIRVGQFSPLLANINGITGKNKKEVMPFSYKSEQKFFSFCTTLTHSYIGQHKSTKTKTKSKQLVF